MTIIIVNGNTYDTDDLAGAERVYRRPTVTGTGLTLPYYVAIMEDYRADNGKNLIGYSTETITVASGVISFNLSTEIPYTLGSWVIMSSASDPSGKWMVGQVTSRTGVAMQITVPDASYRVGNGSVASDWEISPTGIQGPEGATTLQGVATGTIDMDGNNIVGARLPRVIEYIPVNLMKTVKAETLPLIKNAQENLTLRRMSGICQSGTFDFGLNINGVVTAQISVTDAGAAISSFSDSTISKETSEGQYNGNNVDIVISNVSSAQFGYIIIEVEKEIVQI